MLLNGENFAAYRVIRQLGAGGMGEVYLAEDLRLHRKVALKVLPPATAADEVSRKRLLREARAAAALDHPNICTVYDVGDADGRTFIAMQYVEGETLSARARRPMAAAEAVSIAVQIASALAEAHHHGLVHRDIKPQNVMLTAATQVKVLDFGVATQTAPEGLAEATATNLTAAMDIAGTIPYMSPEQLRGEALDARSDVFSFGVVFYELLAGTHPFARRTPAETISAILTQEPPPAGRVDASQELRRIVRKSLEKDRERRYQSMRDLAIDLENIARRPAPRPARPRWLKLAAAGGAFVVTAVAAALLYVNLRERPLHIASAEFTPLTTFPDSVSAPSLSPDGRMVAFIRGDTWFLSTGQIYVKVLPGGEAKQLTNDSRLKYGPVFTPDGSRITYSVGPAGSTDTTSFDTWSVPVLGGEPSPMLPNASGLTWLDDQQVLFSEIERGGGLHMGVVTATVDRGSERRIYFPAHERAMAHFGAASPDRKWVLIVEMDRTGQWQPCRLVPFDGSSSGRTVGPDGRCGAAAWSPDGRYMYFSAVVSGTSHLWRQRFPNGSPEQMTSGSATREEGIAVMPDGRSLVTSVGQANGALWIHDASGDRLLPLEGRISTTIVSRDGQRAYCLVSRTTDPVALGVTVLDLASGRTDRVLTDFAIDDFDESDDAKAIAFQTVTQGGERQIWVSDLDRRTAPRQMAVNADLPQFAGSDAILFRALSEKQNYLEMIKLDGTGRHRITQQPVVDLSTVSPNGKWAVAGVPESGGTARTMAVPTDGGAPMVLCVGFCRLRWSPGGRYLYIEVDFQNANGHTLVIPLDEGRAFPAFPRDATQAVVAWESLPGVRRLAQRNIDPTPDPSTYLFRKSGELSNLFRIPLR